ncbi:MAG: NAD-dependent epimerase/dehydratase family protein [Bdellovibrionaceae bacterium]|nr:NAD-dependent epimerase/dehydratase family protein [Pseudobdellovibrionaceae bacterium]
MKVVVTGANGFLGSWVVRALQKEGADVHALVRPSGDLSELDGTPVKFVHGDVTSLESLQSAFAGADSVFHLAGLISYKRSQRGLMEKVNVGGTRHVLEACRTAKVRRLVHLSSVTAIGAGFSRREILNENSPYNIARLRLGYFDTKREAEQLVREAVWKGEVDAVILNPSTIYGPGDARKGSRKTQIKVARGEFPFYTSGGVSVIHIEDAITGILAGWRKGRSGERYILSGENLLIRDLFRLIAEEAGVEPPHWRLPSSVLFALGALGDLKEKCGMSSSVSVENAWSSTLYHWFDNSKAKREFALNPRPAREALKASVDWMKENGLLKT